MAPERTESVAVFDLSLNNSNKLQGLKKYYDAKERFHVNWDAKSQPEGYKPIYKGVAYYCLYENKEPTDKTASTRSASEEPISGDDSDYLWSEGGFTPGEPSLMMILILPRGYTIAISKEMRQKKPLGAKSFDERLALYWMPIADSDGRADIVWTLKPFEGDIKPEVKRINKARAVLLTHSPVDLVKEDIPSWFPIAGAGFGGLTLLFLMLLIVLSLLFSKEIPMTSRFIVVAFLAISVGLSSTFLGGTAAAKGVITLPFIRESPMSFAVTGGIAVFVIVLMLGYVLYMR
jgi:hypothetical protein